MQGGADPLGPQILTRKTPGAAGTGRGQGLGCNVRGLKLQVDVKSQPRRKGGGLRLRLQCQLWELTTPGSVPPRRLCSGPRTAPAVCPPCPWLAVPRHAEPWASRGCWATVGTCSYLHKSEQSALPEATLKPIQAPAQDLTVRENRQVQAL